LISPPTLAGSFPRDAETAAPSLPDRAVIAGLLARARSGDSQSLGELLSRYRTYLTLLGTAQFQRKLQPRLSPSDVVQEALLCAHRHFGQFRGQTEPELVGWLREILVNSLAKFVERHVRAAKRDVRREVSLNGFSDAVSELAFSTGTDDHQSISAGLMAGEASQRLSQLLGQLPDHYREVLVLRNLQGLSFEQVAARLDRSPGATRMLWLRAIEKLRAVFRKAEQHDH
jgi:RNA polymerase sigma-70 factor (ECF subfamily)